jgi:pSer/pThr/pTyr-binding forkhead associated (FHA) protein
MNRLILKSAVFPEGAVVLSTADLPVTIGRSHRADITVNDQQLSRIHSEIRATADGGFEILDRESTNLTIVNERDVEACVLQSGDLILLGETELIVEIQSVADDQQERTTREIPVVRNPESGTS